MEEKTKEQAHSNIWFQQRSGRVTASKFRSARCTNEAQPAVSLIKAICYPKGAKFKSKATTWGCEHEEQAKIDYKNKLSNKHVDFSIAQSGFIISPSYPLMGASPDGIINCQCCGCGVLEIKCPYSCHDKTFQEKINESHFFSERN